MAKNYSLKLKKYQQTTNKLDVFIQNGRSPAVYTMAQAQKNYYQSISKFAEDKLPNYLHSELTTVGQDQSGAMMLCAEYSIDFAKQSIQYALITILTALSMREKITTNSRKKDMNEEKSPKKPLIYYYVIALLCLLLFNSLVVPWLGQR